MTLNLDRRTYRRRLCRLAFSGKDQTAQIVGHGSLRTNGSGYGQAAPVTRPSGKDVGQGFGSYSSVSF